MVRSLTLEESKSQAIFQRKRISLALSFSFQRAFQQLGSRGEETEEVLGLLISLKAKLVENKPLEEGVQM
jgi:hypothetical protein